MHLHLVLAVLQERPARSFLLFAVTHVNAEQGSARVELLMQPTEMIDQLVSLHIQLFCWELHQRITEEFLNIVNRLQITKVAAGRIRFVSTV